MNDHPSRSAEPAEALRYSIVVPFFNEQENVATLIEEITVAMEARAYEIVAIDDHSTDSTLAVLRELATRHPRLRIVEHACNRGQSAAICSGADAARGVWLVTLDGDGQNDPADIPGLLARIEQDPERPALLCGNRRTRRDNFVRRLSSRVANGVRGALLGDGTPDTGCGLKLIARETFMRLPRFDHMHRFLPALVLRDGSSVRSVAVRHRPRLHGQSKYGVGNRLWVGIVDLFGVMWLQRRAFRNSESRQVK